MTRQLISTLVAILFAVGSSIGQTTTQPASPITAEMRAAANDAFQRKDWKTAAASYEKIIQAEPKNAGANYRLGVVLLNLDRVKEASAHLETAMTISPNSVFALALARAQARNGEAEKLYATFEKSLTLGGISAESLNVEKDFTSLRTAPKFIEYAKKLDAIANPCRARPEHRQFDFWIGEWAPQNVQGVTVGTSSIQLILKDCIIFENWNTPVSSGKSFNLYDVKDGKWHQTWVDASGSMVHYVGGLEGDKMVLTSDTVTNGKKSIGKMTFSKLPDGNVRQHGETSVDDGKTWTTTFDFKYVRVK